MTQVILGKSRVREICMPGSVRAKAKWLSYSTNPDRLSPRDFCFSSFTRKILGWFVASLLAMTPAQSCTHASSAAIDVDGRNKYGPDGHFLYRDRRRGFVRSPWAGHSR